MERVKIQVYLRDKTGKEIAKKIRKDKNAPAIVYGKGLNLPVRLDFASLKILNSIHFSESAIIDMEVINEKNKETFPVIIKDVQYDPLTERVIHLDFMKVSLEEKIKVYVPVELKGEPAGLKEGATLGQVLRDIEIEGLPLDIPEKIELDVASLEIGHSMHVADIKVAENLKIITSPEETIVTLVAKVEEVIEEVVPEEGVPEGPEVIKEKKEEVKEEEAGKEAKAKKEQKEES